MVCKKYYKMSSVEAITITNDFAFLQLLKIVEEKKIVSLSSRKCLHTMALLVFVLTLPNLTFLTSLTSLALTLPESFLTLALLWAALPLSLFLSLISAARFFFRKLPKFGKKYFGSAKVDLCQIVNEKQLSLSTFVTPISIQIPL